LADNQKVSCDILHGAIHGAVFVRENAEVSYLVRQPDDIFAGISRFDAEEDQESLIDSAHDLSFDLNRGANNALDNCTHGDAG
jgi:hypothetical protein